MSRNFLAPLILLYIASQAFAASTALDITNITKLLESKKLTFFDGKEITSDLTGIKPFSEVEASSTFEELKAALEKKDIKTTAKFELLLDNICKPEFIKTKKYFDDLRKKKSSLQIYNKIYELKRLLEKKQSKSVKILDAFFADNDKQNLVRTKFPQNIEYETNLVYFQSGIIDKSPSKDKSLDTEMKSAFAELKKEFGNFNKDSSVNVDRVFTLKATKSYFATFIKNEVYKSLTKKYLEDDNLVNSFKQDVVTMLLSNNELYEAHKKYEASNFKKFVVAISILGALCILFTAVLLIKLLRKNKDEEDLKE